MSERSAGILLHITSLPSEFGLGDLGPEAYAFADMLSRCGQKFWQILPLNFVDASANFSPYSSVSSMAGNILLISPQLLVEDGVLDVTEIKELYLPQMAKINFAEVVRVKNEIFRRSWQNFKGGEGSTLGKAFKKFCLQEEWLDDFALYSIIKEKQNNKPWFEWPGDFKKRKASVLQEISKQEKEAIEKIKFLQFIFFKQWQGLKNYCNKKRIQILGDLPYYVSHDSVDVWTNPELFKIDKNGKLIEVAGTPPDLFSEEGQLWNMPVYKWKKLERTKYRWWIDRMKMNQKLFDLVRLDHFRGFSAYWSSSAKDSSSKNGSWKKGPGAELFRMIKKKSERLHFVAEDLGEIDEAVIKLREQLHFPGMKILQFAFGMNMPDSEHIPHNYEENFFVFTGTHDNNTTKGWWRKDIDDLTRARINEYCNKELTEENIASEFTHLAYASVARTAIIPMQDILNLDESARMNIPGTNENNWNWRLLPGQLNPDIESKLKKLMRLYNR